jgi:hypothetical protein
VVLGFAKKINKNQKFPKSSDLGDLYIKGKRSKIGKIFYFILFFSECNQKYKRVIKILYFISC